MSAFPNVGQMSASTQPGVPKLKLPKLPARPGSALKLPKMAGAGHVARNALLSGMRG